MYIFDLMRRTLCKHFDIYIYTYLFLDGSFFLHVMLFLYAMKIPNTMLSNVSVAWQMTQWKSSHNVFNHTFHFYASLKAHMNTHMQTMLENEFYFYASLKHKLCLKWGKWACPPAWCLNSRYMPPKLQSIGNGLKVQHTRDWSKSTRIKQARVSLF